MRLVAIANRQTKIPGLTLPGLDPSSIRGRVLIAEAWNATPHLQTGAEIALRLAQEGYSVDYLFYGHLLPYVEYFDTTGQSQKKRLAYGEIAPQEKIQKILKVYIKQFGLDLRILHPQVNTLGLPHSIPLCHLESFEELKSYSCRSYKNIGISVASSLVSIIKDSSALPSLYSDVCNKLATSYVQSYSLIQASLENSDISAAVLFNGRFACIKGAADSFRNANVKIFYHERGSSKDYFSLRDYQPHDRQAVQKDIRTEWINRCLTGKHQLEQANFFFLSKKEGTSRQWLSFTDHQKPGCAAEIAAKAKALSSTGIVLTFFSSSEDEFIAVDDAFERDVFEWKSQSEAFATLVRHAINLGHSVIIRQHPHLAKKGEFDAAKWAHLDFVEPELRKKIINIAPVSEVSTYELIELSDIVCCHGSTVGIESVYWGRPCILLANSFYDQIGASIYQPKTKQELIMLLQNPANLKADPATVLPYGHYCASFGTKFVLYKAESLFSGSFCGLNLEAPTRRQRLSRLLRLSAKRIYHIFRR